MELTMEKAKEIVANVGGFPPIPSVILESMKLLNDPMATVKTIQEQILLDRSLTAFILKVANSVLYKLMREVTSVSYAINLMGYNTTKSILTAYLSKNLYSTRGGKLIQDILWRHSISTAVLSKITAEHLKIANPEDAFIAGLLHDVGKGILLKNKTEKFDEIIQLICSNNRNSLEAEREVLGFTHVEVGYLLMQNWRFSVQVIETLIYHHNIQQYHGDNLMVPVVSLANKSSHRLDYSFDKPQVQLSELSMLNVTEKKLVDIEREAEEEINNYLEIFG
jgi:putative nucleotidyltransferase with HDIG domain